MSGYDPVRADKGSRSIKVRGNSLHIITAISILQAMEMPGSKALKMALPDWPWLNAALISPLFSEIHGRAPVAIDDPNAIFNDYVFWRMTSRTFSSFERKCADKIESKGISKELCPDLRTPTTRLVIDVKHSMEVSTIAGLLEPLRGQSLIAKPAHSCGATLFLNSDYGESELADLLDCAKRSFFTVHRERQYAGMLKRIVVEDIVGNSPQEYKFVCVSGEPLVCQFYGNDRAARPIDILSVPSFEPLHPNFSNCGMAPLSALEKMVQYARELSAMHDLLRVDFYYAAGEISLGELTLTPGASLSVAPGDGSHAAYSAALMPALLSQALKTRPPSLVNSWLRRPSKPRWQAAASASAA